MPLRADQGHALAMLSSAGRDGAIHAFLSAHGLDASMMAGLVNRTLSILAT